MSKNCYHVKQLQLHSQYYEIRSKAQELLNGTCGETVFKTNLNYHGDVLVTIYFVQKNILTEKSFIFLSHYTPKSL